MGPLKQLQQTPKGSAEVNTKQPGALYNLAHNATITDISGSGTLPVENNLAQDTEVNPGAIPTGETNPASTVDPNTIT